jgi:hypothetical protein
VQACSKARIAGTPNCCFIGFQFSSTFLIVLGSTCANQSCRQQLHVFRRLYQVKYALYLVSQISSVWFVYFRPSKGQRCQRERAPGNGRRFSRNFKRRRTTSNDRWLLSGRRRRPWGETFVRWSTCDGLNHRL